MTNPGLGQAQKCGGFNRLMGSQPSPLDYRISKGNNTYISKQEFFLHIFASTQKDHILSQKLKDNISMDNTIA
jgi:hypothetical protein